MQDQEYQSETPQTDHQSQKVNENEHVNVNENGRANDNEHVSGNVNENTVTAKENQLGGKYRCVLITGGGGGAGKYRCVGRIGFQKTVPY